MSLDACVRCRCIQDGLANAHPLPGRLILDQIAEPDLNGDPSLEEYLLHDRWGDDSCQHGGYLISERLGNISMIAHMRELIGRIELHRGVHTPILKEKIIYNGVHAGDHLPVGQTVPLMKEVETVLESGDVVEEMDLEFFAAVKRLCEASISTGNPIRF